MERKEKRNISKSLLKGTLVAGAFFGVSSLTAATTSSLYDYDALGSGSEVRSEILGNTLQATSPNNNFELNCGEGKCGEGKCGEEKKDAKKTEAKAEDKSKEAKCGEGKCGEGKCGEDKKDAKKTEAKAEDKSKEAKCGEGKCGN